MKKLKKDYFIFYLSRVVSMLIKPLLIWMVLRKDYQAEADLIALFYLVLASVMVLLNNEAHFFYYKSYFNTEKQENALLITQAKLYIKRLLIHGISFFVLIYIATFIMIGDWVLSTVFVVLIYLEKVFDEVQRMLQYKKEFTKWSVLILFKTTIPFIVCLIFIKKANFLINGYFIALFLVGFFPLLYIKKSYFKLFYSVITTIRKQDFGYYFIDYFKKLIFNQIQSFSSRNIPLLDRIIIRFLAPGFLAEYTIICQLASLSVMGVDFFLISHRRSDYLEKTKTIFSIVKKQYLIATYVLIFAGISAMFLVIKYFNFMNLNNFSGIIVFIIAAYYTTFAISQHFALFAFWRKPRKTTILVDIIFYTISVLSIILFQNHFSLLYVIGFTLLFSNFVRLFSLIVINIPNKFESSQ